MDLKMEQGHLNLYQILICNQIKDCLYLLFRNERFLMFRILNYKTQINTFIELTHLIIHVQYIYKV